jgi:hypothetical protein
MRRAHLTQLAALVAALPCLMITSCVTPEIRREQARDKEFLDRYPTVKEGDKSYKVIPPEDILMREEVPPPPSPSENGSSVHISLDKRRAWLYKNGQLALTAPICAGREGYETPEGEFRVISKHRDWISTIYKVPMPFFLRLNADAGRVGLHAGKIGLEHLAHGCIRLPRKMAELFFDALPVGSTVVVRSSETP